MRNITRQYKTAFGYGGYCSRAYDKFRTAFFGVFCHSLRMATPPDERVRQLCALLATAKEEELDKAIAELRSAITALVENAHNVSTFNLINFPAAMDKRKKA
jgi:hypothetical protein